MENFNWQQYKYQLGTHHQKSVIWISFPNDRHLINHIRSFTKAKWSATQKCWYVSDVANYRELFHLEPKTISKEALLKIDPINQPAFKTFTEQLKLKSYSPNTIKTYCTEFASFLSMLKSVSAQTLAPQRLRSYFLYCVNNLKLSDNSMHSRINAVKFYYEQVLHRDRFFIDIPRPKKPSLLPKAINQQDIAKMFKTIDNLKHLMLLQLCYGMGLRVSEVVKIKLEHIDSKSMQVLISSAKGKKDRYVNLPESILDPLRNYYKQYKPKAYLFEGQYGQQYATRSVQAVFKNAMKLANINKTVGVHSLRHSYATHLLDAGTDILFIQKLLGHNDVKTTLRYTAISDKNIKKIKSPLDHL